MEFILKYLFLTPQNICVLKNSPCLNSTGEPFLNAFVSAQADCSQKTDGGRCGPFLPCLATGSALHRHKLNIGRESSNCSLATGSQSLILH